MKLNAEADAKVVMQWIDLSGKIVAQQSQKKKIPAGAVSKFSSDLNCKESTLMEYRISQSVSAENNYCMSGTKLLMNQSAKPVSVQ